MNKKNEKQENEEKKYVGIQQRQDHCGQIFEINTKHCEQQKKNIYTYNNNVNHVTKANMSEAYNSQLC